MRLRISILLMLTFFIGTVFFTPKVEAVTVSIATNITTYISGDNHAVSIGLTNPGANPVTVDVYVAKLLTDGTLLFVQYDIATNISTFSPGTLNNSAGWVPAVSNLTLPPGFNLQGFTLLQQAVSNLDSLGQYTWFIALATPGTQTFISNLASASYVISSAANILTGTWTGTWTDTVFNVSGAANITITRTGNTLNSTGSINLQSIPLANASGTATGTITDAIGNMLTFPFGAALLGSGSGSINNRVASGTGSVLPSIGFGPFIFNGTIVDGNSISGTFTYTNQGAGAGTLSLTKM